jgi:arylsulfatase A-like enzyme
MATLDELGLAEDTVVVIASDNGGSHRATDNAPLRGFKGTGYEGGLRVPLIVRWPGRVRPGAVSRAVTINTDFYPTLLEAAGLPLRPGQHKDGVSLVPVLTGEREDLEREAIYWHFPHYHRTTPFGAVRAGRWKLIEYLERGAVELYDLERDIGESVNLAGARPEVTERLRGMLRAWRERIDAAMPKPNPNADPTQETHRSRGNPWTTEWERYGR